MSSSTARRRAVRSVPALIAVLAFVALAVFNVARDNPDQTDVASAPGSTSSTTTSTTIVPDTTTSSAVGDSGDAASTTGPDGSGPPVTSGAQAGTTVAKRGPTPPEPRCATSPAGPPLPARSGWEESFQTKPEPNDPLVITVCVDDVTPAVGQKVVASVTVDDPDALVFDGPCDVDVQWQNEADFCRDFIVVEDGPQPTPPEQRGHQEMTFEHTYTRTGDSALLARGWSGPDDGRDHPYKSYSSVSLELSVHRG